jgi:hypothetical protein
MKLLSIAALAPAILLTAAYAQDDTKPAAEAPPQPPIDARVDEALAASPKACFNFDQVTAFKTIDADTIRIETNDARKFDLDLTGPQCSPLDSAGELSIKAAPVFKLCTGILGRGRISFQSAAGAEPFACTIAKVGIATGESAKSK